jgi:hypothetical protein
VSPTFFRYSVGSVKRKSLLRKDGTRERRRAPLRPPIRARDKSRSLRQKFLGLGRSLRSGTIHTFDRSDDEVMDSTDLPIKYDAKYADRVMRMSWHRSTHGYARHCWSEGGFARWVSMHRLVWAWEHGWENVPRYIDHINGDRMDNRLENLRPATLSLNAHNARRKKPRIEALPQGVGRQRRSAVSPYCAVITHGNRSVHLGVFATVAEAKAAYDEAKSRILAYEVALSLGQSPEPLYLPVTKRSRGRPKQKGREEAKALYLSGMTAEKVAEHLGCCSETARRLLRDSGITLRRGRRTLDRSPSAGTLDARSAPQQEQSDDYGNNHRERGKGTSPPHDTGREDDGELLSRLDGEEGRSDDMG